MVNRINYLEQELTLNYPGAKGGPADLDRAGFAQRTMPARYKACYLDIKEGRFATARAIARTCLAFAPDDPESLVVMGVTIREWAVNKEPRPNRSPALKSGPPTNLPEKEGARKTPRPKLAEAEPYLTEAVQKAPQYAPGFRELGDLYDKMGRWTEAAEALQKYLELSPQARDHAKIEKKIEEMKTKMQEKAPDPVAGDSVTGEEKE